MAAMSDQPNLRATLSRRVNTLRERFTATLKRSTLTPKRPQKHRSSLEVGYVVLPKSLFYFKIRPEDVVDSPNGQEQLDSSCSSTGDHEQSGKT